MARNPSSGGYKTIIIVLDNNNVHFIVILNNSSTRVTAQPTVCDEGSAGDDLNIKYR
jgi:hypothetical protein